MAMVLLFPNTPPTLPPRKKNIPESFSIPAAYTGQGNQSHPEPPRPASYLLHEALTEISDK